MTTSEADPGHIPPVTFTVTGGADLPRAQAFEQWEAVLSECYFPLAAQPDDSPGFHGSIERGKLGGVWLSTVDTSRQSVLRTRSGIAHTDDEYLIASVYTEGRARLHQDDRVAELTPGDMVFYESTRPYRWDIDGPGAQVIVQVPTALLRAELGVSHVSLPTATTVRPDTAAGVVARFFLDLARIQHTAADEAAILASGAVPLFAAGVNLLAGQQPTGASGSLLTRERVTAFVRDRCGDPALTVDDIARGCLLSRRSLYRLFDETGEGLGALLRRLRVERACALLRAERGRPTATVAVEAGFASERHFFRAFRAEMGMTPGEYRMLHGATGSPAA
ncbi:helix-turn-helix domain-containing protein [Nocardia thailandica]